MQLSPVAAKSSWTREAAMGPPAGNRLRKIPVTLSDFPYCQIPRLQIRVRPPQAKSLIV